MRQSQARHRARHANAQRAFLAQGWQECPGLVEKHVFGRVQRRCLAIVDGDGFVGFGQMHQHEAAAAEIAGAGQGDSQGKPHRHRRIHRIAAAFQNIEADRRGPRLLAHHHAVAGDDGQFAGKAGGKREGIGAGEGRGEGKGKREAQQQAQ